MSPILDRPDGNGWRLTGRAVWVMGGAEAARLGESLRAAEAHVTVSPAPRAGAWAEDAGLATGRLDGLALVLDDPGDDARPGARRHADPATVVTDRLGAIFCAVRAAARRMVDSGGAIVLVAPEDWADGLTPGSLSGALESLVRSLAIALGSAGITVNLVSVRPPASGSRPGDAGRAVEGPVAYLLARDTSYLTGQVLRVDPAPRAGAE